jgi:hypothetical protein
LGGLLNELNSCYLDSTLFSLFFKDNEFLNTFILDAPLDTMKIVVAKGTNRQKIIPLKSLPTLLSVAQNIQMDLQLFKQHIQQSRKTKCTDLRQHLTQYQTVYQQLVGPLTTIEWKRTQLEPLDVISRLNHIFNWPDPVTISYLSQAVDTRTRQVIVITEEQRQVPFQVIIDSFALGTISGSTIVPQTKLIELRQLLTQPTTTRLEQPIEGHYNYLVSTTTYMSAPLLYLHLNRLVDQSLIGGTGLVKLTTRVFPMSSFLLSNQHTLDLTAIIVHSGTASGGHYTSYIKCDDLWYHYDDVRFTQLKLMGDFASLLKNESHGNAILSGATDYFYM